MIRFRPWLIQHALHKRRKESDAGLGRALPSTVWIVLPSRSSCPATMFVSQSMRYLLASAGGMIHPLFILRLVVLLQYTVVSLSGDTARSLQLCVSLSVTRIMY